MSASGRTRPAAVPDAAWWDDSDAAWVLGERDDAARRHGAYLEWRTDGTMAALVHYEHGRVVAKHLYDANGQRLAASLEGGAAPAAAPLPTLARAAAADAASAPLRPQHIAPLA